MPLLGAGSGTGHRLAALSERSPHPLSHQMARRLTASPAGLIFTHIFGSSGILGSEDEQNP
jgi:hypothetical protein